MTHDAAAVLIAVATPQFASVRVPANSPPDDAKYSVSVVIAIEIDVTPKQQNVSVVPSG
jgi:hypothetical protein